MIDRTHELPLMQQCKLLELARSTAYYQPAPVSPEELALTRRIDELHLNYSFASARMLSKMLKRDGQPVGRRHVSTLMKRMNIHALYRKPNTSKRHAKHLVYPYLLRNLSIAQSNHVWAADPSTQLRTGITYIPMRRGFVYLFAVLDWASRWVLSWRLSNTLTTDFSPAKTPEDKCIDAVQEAINRYGKPEIFNTDQGCHNQRLGGRCLLA